MCGIAGIVDARSGWDVEAAMSRMVASLRHRGPDGKGSALVRSHESWRVGLGHTRLSIIDLSDAASQPMRDEATGNWIVFNGEIYNFREIRAELIVLGHSFKSHSDTEVILKGYAQWGLTVIKRLSGMFALALWDEKKKTLLLARDPLGIKPLYLYDNGKGCWVFASEVRSILASGVFRAKIDPEAVQDYLAYGAVLAPRTIIHGIESLLPGQFVTLNSHGVQRVRYWNPIEVAVQARLTDRFEEAVEIVRGALSQSARRHLVSDVPVAAFLSGGIDSSVIASFLRNSAGGEDLKAFSLVFGQSRYDERAYVDAVSRKLRLPTTQMELTEEYFARHLDLALDSLDQPSLDGVNSYFIARLVHDHGIKVAISGTGGDELFGGYDTFRRVRLANHAGVSIPWAIRHGIAHILDLPLSQRPSKKKLIEYLRAPVSVAHYCAISRRLFAPEEIARMTGVPRRPDDQILPEYLVSGLSALDGQLETAISLMETQLYMQNILLRDIDSASMASSLEVRVPLLDKELVEISLRLPAEMKRPRHTNKPLLVEAARGYMPPALFSRPKKGFAIPIAEWIRATLRQEIGRFLDDPARLETIGIRPELTREIWRNYREGQRSEGWARVWALYSLARWADRHSVLGV